MKGNWISPPHKTVAQQQAPLAVSLPRKYFCGISPNPVKVLTGRQISFRHLKIDGVPQQTWFVPRLASQDYYWSAAWQAGERESLEEYRRGEGVNFDCSEDAIKWLLGD
jgi:hypothetical protein